MTNATYSIHIHPRYCGVTAYTSGTRCVRGDDGQLRAAPVRITLSAVGRCREPECDHCTDRTPVPHELMSAWIAAAVHRHVTCDVTYDGSAVRYYDNGWHFAPGDAEVR